MVTPNKRLSQALMADFDAHQIRRDLKVWEAPDILPFDAFVEQNPAVERELYRFAAHELAASETTSWPGRSCSTCSSGTR